MLGLLLVLGSSLFQEIGITIGKKKVKEREESVYTMGFLTVFWSGVLLLTLGLFIKDEFRFMWASLPTFALRTILEIAQAHVATLAIVHADRSTATFLMVLTIPLLLATDFLFSYSISATQILGIAIILSTLIMLWVGRGIKTKGFKYVLFTAINAVITISLYKYDITYFNSVEAEQGIILAILAIYFAVMALVYAKENAGKFLFRPIFLAESLVAGVGTILVSFAYLFGPASVITTAKRAATILAAILSGNLIFHEHKTRIKFIALTFMLIGMTLLVI